MSICWGIQPRNKFYKEVSKSHFVGVIIYSHQRLSPRNPPSTHSFPCSEQQELFITSCDDLFLFEGTSMDGFAVKKSEGRKFNWKISAGLYGISKLNPKESLEKAYMTGQSSTRGLWVRPKTLQRTTSSFAIGSFRLAASATPSASS